MQPPDQHDQQQPSLRPSRKKPMYRVSEPLRYFLRQHGREKKHLVNYSDLRQFNYSVPLKDKHGNDTQWETVSYDSRDWDYLREVLVETYAVLRTEGDFTFVPQLDLARIDFCPFGNSQPFRIRIVNKFNDNYDHYYVKYADASRIYGLELEHMLSPNRMTFLTCGDTLIEEHIPGIPGDVFIKQYLNSADLNPIRFAKEFVKFNERCFVRLLGDMRSYNFVVNLTPDVEDFQYRIRAIDFDQQSYEGRKNLYLSQFLKENFPLVDLTLKSLNRDSIEQYQAEERTMMAFRLVASRYRIKHLLDIMAGDELAPPAKIEQLKQELASHFDSPLFLKCKSMGDIVKQNLKQTLRKSLLLVPRMRAKYDD
ncbi:MAG: hypothetical protein MUF62_01345 [Chitinophagaceae bacterium]|nr:hypothetical protein [Chitinophagaceae bacterium]